MDNKERWYFKEALINELGADVWELLENGAHIDDLPQKEQIYNIAGKYKDIYTENMFNKDIEKFKPLFKRLFNDVLSNEKESELYDWLRSQLFNIDIVDMYWKLFISEIKDYPKSQNRKKVLRIIKRHKPHLFIKNKTKQSNEAHTQSDQNTAPSKESEQMPPESPKLQAKYYSLTYIFETLANGGKIYDFKGGKKAFFDKYAISKESEWAGNSIMKDFNFLTDKNKYTSKEKLNEYFNKDFNFNETVEKVLSIVESQNKTKVTNWIEKNVK